jgi:hypothetical protein
MKPAISLIILLSLFFVHCDSLFSTREPELPVNPQSSWVPPLSAEQVLANLQNAIFERNLENFTRSLVNPSSGIRTFRFDPDPEVASNYAVVFQDWNQDKERSVMQQAFALVPTDSTLFLAFIENIQEVIVSDSAVLVRKYRLELHHGESSLPSDYEGISEFWLSPDQQGEWSIYRWIDNRVSGLPSWSLLKASLGG